MTEEMEERRVPNFLRREEEHMRIKRELQLTKYQIRVFQSELNHKRKQLEKLRAGMEQRRKSYNCKYKTVEELDQAYIVGAIKDDKEYMRQRSAIWQVYSDRGHDREIEWLETELLRYTRKLENIENLMIEKHNRMLEKDKKKRLKRKHQAALARKYRRERKKKELQERWKRYGIG